jgi:hypothetical protein
MRLLLLSNARESTIDLLSNNNLGRAFDEQKIDGFSSMYKTPSERLMLCCSSRLRLGFCAYWHGGRSGKKAVGPVRLSKGILPRRTCTFLNRLRLRPRFAYAKCGQTRI